MVVVAQGYCSAGDTWDCARGITMGTLTMLTAFLCTYALSKVASIWIRTRWYSVELTMITLGLIQMVLSSINFFFLRESRLSIAVKFVRGLQCTLTCALYGRLALLCLKRQHLIKRALLPASLLVVLYYVTIFVVALSDASVDCFHPTWMLMSVSGVVIGVSFALSGGIVMREIGAAAAVKAQYSSLMGGGQQQLAQKRHQLWTLLLVNAGGSVFQLCLDLYTHSLYERAQDCRVLSDLDSAPVQLLRAFLQMVSQVLPVLTILYVFYWVPRRQYDTALDVALPPLDREFDAPLLLAVGSDDDSSASAAATLGEAVVLNLDNPWE